MKFGDNLKVLRKDRKISQEDLAEAVGVSRQSVSKWETGEAYPEMNNILQLCKIFKCHINDLVHANMSDIDFLGEDVKSKVVKFKEEKQKKMKIISKFVSLVAKIGKIVSLIICTSGMLLLFLVPLFINKLKVVDKDLMVGSTKLVTLQTEYEVNAASDFIISHSSIELIIWGEVIVVCLIITCIFTVLLFKYLEKLFKNIHDGETPFTLENVSYIKKIAIYLISYILFPTISGYTAQFISGVDLGIDFEIMDVVLALIIYGIAYIFEYGYELQLDSKGVMYGEEE